jgi:hypothetical protein
LRAELKPRRQAAPEKLTAILGERSSPAAAHPFFSLFS